MGNHSLLEQLISEATRYEWRARSARKASRTATSGAARFQMQGRAEMAEEFAARLRALVNRYDDE